MRTANRSSGDEKLRPAKEKPFAGKLQVPQRCPCSENDTAAERNGNLRAVNGLGGFKKV